MALKTGVDPGGISKWDPSFRSMVLAWPMKKVESCEKEMARAIVDAQMGRTRTKDFELFDLCYCANCPNGCLCCCIQGLLSLLPCQEICIFTKSQIFSPSCIETTGEMDKMVLCLCSSSSHITAFRSYTSFLVIALFVPIFRVSRKMLLFIIRQNCRATLCHIIVLIL